MNAVDWSANSYQRGLSMQKDVDKKVLRLSNWIGAVKLIIFEGVLLACFLHQLWQVARREMGW